VKTCELSRSWLLKWMSGNCICRWNMQVARKKWTLLVCMCVSATSWQTITSASTRGTYRLLPWVESQHLRACIAWFNYISSGIQRYLQHRARLGKEECFQVCVECLNRLSPTYISWQLVPDSGSRDWNQMLSCVSACPCADK